MTEAVIAQLLTPTGLPGSGRLRYAAAMQLNRSGKLSPEALEVFRICSPRDAEDPRALLAQRGLGTELPTSVEPDAEAELRNLLDEADIYLSTLPGPGVAEVRDGLRLARLQSVAARPARPNAVLERWLVPALAELSTTHPALALAIATAAPLLEWITYDSYPPEQIGAAFRTSHAFASLAGQEAPFPADDFDFGLFLIAPHILYRDHCHLAPELYAPLTGPHGWRFGPGASLVLKPAHDPVWNDPLAPHLTKVGAVPFLSFFGWTRDVMEPAAVLPASDWAELEAIRIPV